MTSWPVAAIVPLPGPVVWMTGEYARLSHTFIRREVAALRAGGLDVRTATVRRVTEDLVDPEQRAEAAACFHILEAARRPGSILSHLAVLRRAPRLWARTLGTAWGTAPEGVRGRLMGLAYFHEAAVLACHLRAIGAVHLHNHFAMSSGRVARLAAALAGVTSSFTLHGPDEIAEASRWRLDDAVAGADLVACISAFARSQAMRRTPRAQWAKLHVVHCGIDPALYDRPVRRGGDALLFVGRLAGVKGVPVLLAALARARETRPGLRLTLAGDGPDRAGLEAEARALGLDGAVAFLGAQPPSAVAALLATHDALVLPSFAEGVPVVLMEAMAARLPVIASRIDGIPELVEDGVAGRLVPPGDETALTAAILEILGDPARAAAMGEAGRARVVAEFDAGREAERLARLVRGAVLGAPL